MFMAPESAKAYSRDQLLSIRITTSLPDCDVRRRIDRLLQPRRGCRAGLHVQARRRVSSSLAGNKFPVIITCEQQQSGISCRAKQSLNSTHRSSVLVRLKYQSTTSNRSVNRLSPHTSSDKIQYVPSLYVFNAASLAIHICGVIHVKTRPTSYYGCRLDLLFLENCTTHLNLSIHSSHS